MLKSINRAQFSSAVCDLCALCPCLPCSSPGPPCPGGFLTCSSYPSVSLVRVHKPLSLGQLGCLGDLPADSSPHLVAFGLEATHSCHLPSSLSVPKLQYFLSSQPSVAEVRRGPVQKNTGRDVDQLLILYSLQFCYFHSSKIPCSLFSLS